MSDNFIMYVLSNGGSLHPIVVPSETTNGTGTFNPSIFNDNGDLIVNMRHCQVTFYHAELGKFESQWGPLIYFNPENDISLRTTNYFCKMDQNLDLEYSTIIDTSAKDVPPIWSFIGMEDGRIIKWDNKYYAIGVRRDTTTNGIGRMEFSEIEISHKDRTVKEISRVRIKSPSPEDSWYCEKNWMPILDKPYHFIRWANPIQVVRADPVTGECEIIHESKEKIETQREIRGGSQVLPFADGYIFITHEVDLWYDVAGRKDSRYRHRFFYIDKNWEIVKYSTDFSFADSRIEFCCGLCEYGDDYLISFGVQDNTAFILRCPKKIIEDVLL